ncbi:MAG: hypothetical protein RMJ33_01010 [Saprospiraceae bacterium]|nr:hypothetical protein [Saprospiraceae bacterium]MDW8228388.1 hypothetical protein [Saprospiraceae bacterium]
MKLHIPLIGIACLLRCDPQVSHSQSEKDSPPIALAIGEDVSGSFQQNYSLTKEHINEMCQIIVKSGRGGVVKFYTIGNPTPAGFITCEISPLPPAMGDYKPDPNDNLLERAKKKQEHDKKKRECDDTRARMQAENQQRIDAFLKACASMLNQRGTRYTDLNGFFEKAAIFLKGENVASHAKWLYCNTDGVHDLGNSKPKTVRCDLLPVEVRTYFTGCKPSFTCLNSSDRKLLSDPGEFISVFRKSVLKQ